MCIWKGIYLYIKIHSFIIKLFRQRNAQKRDKNVDQRRTLSFSEQNHGGRKSKYCNSEQKRMVAEYASMHGAAQAARKYNIPPSVAAYYQRKLAKMKQNEKQSTVVLL